MADNSKIFNERQKRYEDTIALRKTDRIPIIPMVDTFPVRYYKAKMSEVNTNHALMEDLWLRYMDEFQPDMGDNPYIVNGFFGIFGALDFKLLKWAGHGLDDNAGYQFVEVEMMAPNHYDWFLSDPSDYMFRYMFPKMYGKLAPLAQLPSIRPHFYHFTPYSWAAMADPNFIETGQAMVKAGQEAAKALEGIAGFTKKMYEAGFPAPAGSMTQAPLDVLGDYLRGIKGMLVDLRRQPQNVLAACEKILPSVLELGLNGCRNSGVPVCFIPLHKCMDGFMSQEQFLKFYWPTLLELIRALIAENITPYLLVEGVCDQRLPIMINDVPAGKCIFHLENSNIFKAKELARDKVCLRGNIPASILCTGSPEDTRQYCKKLIEIAGAGGGFIMDTAVNLTDAKAENVKVMFEYTREHGLY